MLRLSRAKKQTNSLVNLNNLQKKSSSQNTQESYQTLTSITVLPPVVAPITDLPPVVPQDSPNSYQTLTSLSVLPPIPYYNNATDQNDLDNISEISNEVMPPTTLRFNPISQIQTVRFNQTDKINSEFVAPNLTSQETVIDINDPNSAYVLRREAAFAERLNNDTLLLHVRPEDFGIFTGCSSSISFIPEKFLKKTRTVYHYYLKKVVDDKQIRDWLKLILLSSKSY